MHRLLFEGEGAVGWTGRTRRLSNADKDIIRSNLNSFLADPAHVENPYPKSLPLKLAVARYYQREEGKRRFVDQFNVKEKLNSLLGECSYEEETLVDLIQAMSEQSRHFGVVLKNKTIGKATGDAEFKVTIKKNGTDYEVITKFRWHAMQDRPLEQISGLSFTFSSLCSLFDRSKVSFDVNERARALYELLKSTSPLSNE
jgi:hypothetical protein